MNKRFLLAIATAALASSTAVPSRAQTTPPSGAPGTVRSHSGINAGTLSCNVAGGVGFIFGSSKELNCFFAGNDGPSQYYKGTVNRYGIDVGFTKEAHIIWLVFAPGRVESGAIAGTYVGATAAAAVGVGVGANVLVGGSSKQITLQPVSVEGSIGLNVALGVGEITLQAVR